jgi:hypothetical protein
MPLEGFVSRAAPVCFKCNALPLTPGIQHVHIRNQYQSVSEIEAGSFVQLL